MLAALVRSSLLSLLPDLSRDFSSSSSLFLAYFRSAPAASSPLLPLLSLSTALPTPLCSPVVFPPNWWPRSASLLLAVSRFPPPAPPTSDFPPPPGFPPPLSASTSLESGSSHMVPGWVWVSRLLLGLPLPRLTRLLCMCCSRSLSRLRVASRCPACPLLHFRIWVLQRFL